METIIEEWLMKRYEGSILRITRERKEDLKMPNHLLGLKRLYLQIHFRNVSDLLTVRRDIMPLALANSAKLDAVDAYAEVVQATAAKRTRPRLWGPAGLRALVTAITSRSDGDVSEQAAGEDSVPQASEEVQKEERVFSQSDFIGKSGSCADDSQSGTPTAVRQRTPFSGLRIRFTSCTNGPRLQRRWYVAHSHHVAHNS